MIDDEALMTRFYAGQDCAFGQLCERQRPKLVQAALRRLPGRLSSRRERAEELVQDALFKAFNTRQRVTARWDRSKGSLSTWLHAILKNVTCSFLRTKRDKEWLVADLASNDRPGNESFASRVDAGNSEPWRIVAAREQHEWLERAVGQLSPCERTVVHHTFVLGKSRNQTARELNTSGPTISRRLHRAVQSLRRSADQPFCQSIRPVG